MVKYKSVKMECPICHIIGSAQLFLNKNEVRYARIRHYKGLNENKKPQFEYHKIEDLETLKTLLQNKGFQSATEAKTSRSQGQALGLKTHDPHLRSSGFICQNKWAGSSARIEHHPPKASKNIDPQIDWEEYKQFLLSKFSRSYALQVYNNGLRHHDCLENPNNISAVPVTTRGNVLKAMVNLSKYLGTYETYKAKLRNNGVKWANTDDSFNSFLRIVNNNHNSLHLWYKDAYGLLRDNEKLFLKYTLVSGLRKGEAVNSFNLTVELAINGKLSDYYNEELGILEHFRYANLFLRATKKVYISIVSKQLINEIANSQPVSYSAIRKRLNRNNQHLRFKELRSYYATYLRQHGILAEYIDLLQGRIPKSVFARHYLKVEDVRDLMIKVLAITENLERSLLS
jgi:intergrase/recombinase